AITAALTSKFIQSLQKGVTIARVNSVFDCHQDRPLVLFDAVSDQRRGPVHGWSEIDTSAPRELPAPRQRHRQESCRSGNKLRKGFPDHGGNLTPDGTPNRHCAK